MLSKEEVDLLSSQGFVSLPQITTEEEASQIRVRLERLFANRAGENEGAYGELAAEGDDGEEPNSPQINLPVNYAPELHKTKCFLHAREIARQILGEHAAFVIDFAIYKRAGDGEATPWHQDIAFRDPRFEYKEVTIWVALQNIDENSGCMMFVPKSHRGPVYQHRQTNSEGKSISLTCGDEFDAATAVTVEVPVGGCTIHLPQTLHRSTPNHGDVPRIVYIMTFGTPPVPTFKPTVASPWTGAELKVQVQKRRWMRRGGVFITLWRRVRRGALKDWRTLFYLGVRATKTILSGK